MLGKEWSLGVRYRLNDADSRDYYKDVLPVVDNQDPATLKGFRRQPHLKATLHQLSLDALYNHRSGFFAQGQALWYSQSNRGYAPDQPGDDFWQFNVFAGYRFPRRKVELLVGLLNLADRDYRLNPLTLYNELPRERTLLVRLQFNF